MTFSKIKICCVYFLLPLVLAGCELMGPGIKNRLLLDDPIEKDSERKAESPEIYQSEDQQADAKLSEPSVKFYPGTGNFVGTKAVSPARRTTTEKGKYELNFDDADLGEVTKVFLEVILKQNYVINPKVTGRVTLQTSQPLTKEELIPTLEMVLGINGAVLRKEDGLYRIEPKSSALSGIQSPRLNVPGQRLPPGYQVQIIPLRYVGVQEMQKILEPLLPPKAIVRTDTFRNLLMIAGTPRELKNILETISIFDVDAFKGMSVGLYALRNVDAATLIPELQQLFGEESDAPLAEMLRLIPIERLNAVLVITPQIAYLEQAKLWIDRLDQTSTAISGGVHVYRVKNVDAVELAATLNEIFSGKKKSSPTSSARLAPGLTPKEISGKKKQTGKSRNSSKKLISLADVGEVRIIADEPNNSMVIVATAQEYEVILSVIEKLDVVPLQVLIDAEIYEIRLTDNLEYGLKWFIKQGGTITEGNDRAEGLGTLDSLTVGDITSTIAGGFSYGFLSASDKLGVLFTALASDGKLNVISSPSVMVLNNQEATIKVGDQISLSTRQLTDSDNPDAVTSEFQQRDTGVTLTVTPRVNPGGLVIMEVEQKVDTAADSPREGNPNPDIFQRQINSTVAVQSGETLVLGGLISEQTNKTLSGIPILSRLPYIGPLFGTTVKTLARSELVILITPRVVENRQDARDVTLEFKRKLTGIYQETDEEVVEDDPL